MSATAGGTLGLADRSVLVTGAASGIGRAECERLAVVGAGVALVDRDADGLGTVAAALDGRGARHIAITADVSQDAQVCKAEAASALQNLRLLRRDARVEIVVLGQGR